MALLFLFVLANLIKTMQLNLFSNFITQTRKYSLSMKIHENGSLKFQKWPRPTQYNFGTVNSKGHPPLFLCSYFLSEFSLECNCIAKLISLFLMYGFHNVLNFMRRQRKEPEGYLGFQVGWFWHVMMDSRAWLSGRKSGPGTIKTWRQSVMHKCQSCINETTPLFQEYTMCIAHPLLYQHPNERK